MQYFTILCWTCIKFNKKSIFWWVKSKFCCAFGANFFLCHFGFCPPFATPIYALGHRIIELGSLIRHRVCNYNLNPAHVLASLFQFSLAIYCLWRNFSDFASFWLSLLFFTTPWPFITHTIQSGRTLDLTIYHNETFVRAWMWHISHSHCFYQ